jgi:3'-phosphoadenosine 5'-phosphosulfate sulfotransferase
LTVAVIDIFSNYYCSVWHGLKDGGTIMKEFNFNITAIPKDVEDAYVVNRVEQAFKAEITRVKPMRDVATIGVTGYIDDIVYRDYGEFFRKSEIKFSEINVMGLNLQNR